MDVFIETLGGVLLGMVSAPFLLRLFTLIMEWKIERDYEQAVQQLEQEHSRNMMVLQREWNEALDQFNQRRRLLLQRLAHHSVFLETDAQGEEIIVKRIPFSGKTVEKPKWLRTRGGG